MRHRIMPWDVPDVAADPEMPELEFSSDEEPVKLNTIAEESDSDEDDPDWIDNLLRENGIPVTGKTASGTRWCVPTDEAARAETPCDNRRLLHGSGERSGGASRERDIQDLLKPASRNQTRKTKRRLRKTKRKVESVAVQPAVIDEKETKGVDNLNGTATDYTRNLPEMRRFQGGKSSHPQGKLSQNFKIEDFPDLGENHNDEPTPHPKKNKFQKRLGKACSETIDVDEPGEEENAVNGHVKATKVAADFKGMSILDKINDALKTKQRAAREAESQVKNELGGAVNLFCQKEKAQLCPVTGIRQQDHADIMVGMDVDVDPSKWEELYAIVDSGATVPVLHPRIGKAYSVEESAASAAGVEYEIANGDNLPCLGQKRMAVMTEEGTLRGYSTQCADVSKALQSVRSLVKAKHAVCFGLGEEDDQHVIINKLTGEVSHMVDDGINYLQRLMVVPPDQINALQWRMQQYEEPPDQSFGRPGR